MSDNLMNAKLKQNEKNNTLNNFSANRGIKKAVVLAGNQNTRLNPLNNYCPIWMLPILNRPLIDFTIDFLKRNGIKEVAVAVSESDMMHDRIKHYEVSDSIKIYFHKESKPRGTAGAIKDLETFIGDEPFIVINSSTFVSDINLKEAVEYFYKIRPGILVGARKESESNILKEVVKITSGSSVKSFHIIHPSVDKRSPWRSVGIYIFDPIVLKFIDKNIYMDIKEQLIPVLQRESLNISVYEIDGSYQILDSLSDYIQIQRTMLFGDKMHYLNIEGKNEIGDKVWVGKDTKISSKAYLLGPILIGDGCEIQDWAQIIGPTVIGDNCKIADRVILRESILGRDAYISKGAKIEYSIVCDKANVPDNFQLRNALTLDGLKTGEFNLIPQDFNIKDIVDLSGIMTIAENTHKLYKILKRIFDLCLSSIGIVLLFPLFFFIAIAIKTDSAGPVFYIQKRCGKNGRLFGMIKFRTMVANAEKIHEELASKNVTDGPMFKMTNDPRVTKLGRFLRRTSIDEIPQLFNVIKGDMSLVGPRPLIMDEMQFSPSWRDSRLKVKPGITGLWQIQGRSEALFHDWIKYDVYYVKNQSLWLDVKILLKTIKVVFKKVGAY